MYPIHTGFTKIACEINHGKIAMRLDYTATASCIFSILGPLKPLLKQHDEMDVGLATIGTLPFVFYPH